MFINNNNSVPILNIAKQGHFNLILYANQSGARKEDLGLAIIITERKREREKGKE